MNEKAPQKRPFLIGILDGMGKTLLESLDKAGGVYKLLLLSAAWVIRSLTSGVRIGRSAIVSQIVRVGVRSILIISLVSFAVGFILALQMAPTLDDLGQIELVPDIVVVAIVRELGPLIAAVVMTGFAGAAIAAEIGTMVVGEEIEALESQALNPVRFLVVPRLIAVVVSLLALGVIANVVGVGAGMVMGVTILGIPYETYMGNTWARSDTVDFLTGLFKAGVFGVLIAAIACYNGLKVTGGAAGVGNATTRTVVESIVAIIFADLAFTAIFYSLGLV